MISFYFEKIRFEKSITSFSDFILYFIFYKKDYSLKFIKMNELIEF